MRRTAAGGIYILVLVFSMHSSAVLSYSLELSHVQHLAEVLEVVFNFLLPIEATAVVVTVPTLLPDDELLKRFQVCTILDQAADVHLSSYEIPNFSTAVTQWCNHEHVHEWRSITSAFLKSDFGQSQEERGLLVEEDLAVLFARSHRLSEPHSAARMCLWALQETTVTSNRIIHSILCCSMEL